MQGIKKRLLAKNNSFFVNPYFWFIQSVTVLIALIYYSNYYYFDYRWTWFWYLEVFEFNHDLNGILMYIPVLLSIVFLDLRGILVTWAFSLVLILHRIMLFSWDPVSAVNNLLFLTVPILIIGYIALQIKWQEKERSIIIERENEKKYYLSMVLKAQDDERRRIAQQLHDDTTQILLVVATRVQSLLTEGNGSPPADANEQLEWIRDTILNMSDDIRKVSLELRQSALDNMPFVPAIEWLVNSFEHDHNIKTRFVVHGSECELPRNAQVLFFRVVQEALNNIRRHAKATRAYVKILFNPDDITINIGDNGQGFNVNETVPSLLQAKKLGIIGMQERIRFLGGTLNIGSQPGKGTRINIHLRLQDICADDLQW